VPASSLLLLESDPASRGVIAGVLGGVGYAVTPVKDAAEVFAAAGDHQLVIIDVVSGPRTASEICREIRSTPALAAIPVLCISQADDVEDRIRFLEAGADDVMAKPFDARELEARVEALLVRFQRSREVGTISPFEGAAHPTRRLVTVFSPKGGVGTTTIAVNLAVVMGGRRPGRTLLIDLDRQFGQVATHLNLTVRQTLADLVRDELGIREPELIRSYSSHHESGLHVIPAPGSPELAELVQAEHVDQLLDTALQAYDQVVIDAGSHLDEPSLTALERADGVVFTVYPEIAALKALHSLLDVLAEVGSTGTKATFVLNNMFARDILKMSQIESALGTRVAVELPYDPYIYLKAVNEGVPVVLGAPRSAAAERLSRLASVAFDLENAPPAPVLVPDKKSGRLGGLIRR
jgi:pilus assembly protein CpaE